MAAVKIKALKNGTYEVAGDAEVLASTGKEYAESRIDPLYPSRCGASKHNPFCDASHKNIGFTAKEIAG